MSTRVRMPRLRLCWVLALPAVAVLLLVAVSAPAAASCATDRPPRSPSAFVGVVVAVRSEGRVATVRTDSGAEVQVRGTPGGGLGQGTSVDRSYEPGGRYEFHPVNASSPYEDNECTATRLLSMEAVPAARDGAATPGQPADSGPRPMTVVLLGLLGALVVGGLLGLRRHRARLRDP